MKKIEQPIIDYQVVDQTKDRHDTGKPEAALPQADIIHMHEKVDRPEMLVGATEAPSLQGSFLKGLRLQVTKCMNMTL